MTETMVIRSAALWETFPPEKKQRILEEYYNSPTNARKRYLEWHYGKENLIVDNYEHYQSRNLG